MLIKSLSAVTNNAKTATFNIVFVYLKYFYQYVLNKAAEFQLNATCYLVMWKIEHSNLLVSSSTLHMC